METKELKNYGCGFIGYNLWSWIEEYEEGDYVCIKDKLFLFGYLKNDGSFNTQLYEIDMLTGEVNQGDNMLNLPPLIHKHIFPLSFQGKEYILISGGSNNQLGITSNQNWIFDLENKQLKEGAKFEFKKSHHCICFYMTEELYAIGGLAFQEGKNLPQEVIESIPIEELMKAGNTWQSHRIHPRQHFISIHSTAIPFHNQILILGGQKPDLKYNRREAFLYIISDNQISTNIIHHPDRGEQGDQGEQEQQEQQEEDTHIQLEHSTRFYSTFVVMRKQHSLTPGPHQRLSSLNPNLEEEDMNQKLFFVGETNQGYPIIYTMTTNPTQINFPQKFDIFIPNQFIRKGHL